MRKLKLILKYLLCVFSVAAGLNHFINPAFYLKIMPPYLPWHLFLVYLSGFFEVARARAAGPPLYDLLYHPRSRAACRSRALSSSVRL